jgi:hypothetical protein
MLLFSSKKSKPRENEYVLCCFLVARNQNQEKMNMSQGNVGLLKNYLRPSIT